MEGTAYTYSNGNSEAFLKHGRNDDELKRTAQELTASMTLEEKAGLCSGQDLWRLKPVKRLGLEQIMLTDGPNGLRKQQGTGDHLGINDSVPAVCFPTASALACSFDTELACEIGSAIGEECLQEEVSVILGPGANHKRSPLCGRNFEYYSEDPHLSGKMAAAQIRGIQGNGIGASLKHFAVNNQETRRMVIDAVVDERALRENYLKGFEIAVKEGKPWTVMCAYNRINGKLCSENSYLLTDTLRKEWGFDGLVVSDWGAVSKRVEGIKAGMDLEMPGSNGINDAKIVAAVKAGVLPMEELDASVRRITLMILRAMNARQGDFRYDLVEHHRLAARAAAESAVLLKNENGILPGNMNQKAAIIGVLAQTPRYQGAGSSKLHPIRVDNAYDSLRDMGLSVKYAEGYSIKRPKKDEENSKEDERLRKEACRTVEDCDIVYLFAGLPDGYESEAFDRKDLSLPDNQNRVIEAIAAVNPNVVVILSGGAPVELPWISKVKGLLMTYLGGEGVGRAVADLLVGNSVPCGKLAETWPVRLSDTPAYQYFPGGRTAVEYRESIFTGYRYYESAKKPVLFPFGYGLSYTGFSYSNLHTDKQEYEFGEDIHLSFEITNTGTRKAKEAALIFAANDNKKVFMPVKELKGFVKTELHQGETVRLTVSVNTADLAYYNVLIHDWYAHEGYYRLLVGGSLECGLSTTIKLHNEHKPEPDYRETAPSYYHLPDGGLSVPGKEFEELYGKALQELNLPAARPFTEYNTITDIEKTLAGRILGMSIKNSLKGSSGSDEEDRRMLLSMMKEMPFYAMVFMSGGSFSENRMKGLLKYLNGHRIRGMLKLIKG